MRNAKGWKAVEVGGVLAFVAGVALGTLSGALGSDALARPGFALFLLGIVVYLAGRIGGWIARA